MGSVRDTSGDIGDDLENTYYNGIGRHGGYARNFDYHSSWDSIMTVIDKIEALPGVSVYIQNDFCRIKPGLLRPVFTIQNFGENKIEAAYKCVIDFIKHYKLQHKQVNP